MSDRYNSASDYLRSLSEMSDGNYTSFYRSLSGQIMFPRRPGQPAWHGSPRPPHGNQENLLIRRRQPSGDACRPPKAGCPDRLPEAA